MPDTSANIILNATGGAAAAGEINQAAEALNGVVRSHNSMEGAFSHKFQHIGLMLFAGDLLRTSGLGRETRMIIGTLSMGITSLAGAFGLAGGPIMLFVTALGAVAAITEKVISRHEENVANLKKLHEATEKTIKDADEQIAAVEKYIQYSGKATDADKAYLAQLKKVRQEQIDLQIKTDEAEILGLEAVIKTQQAHIREVGLERGVIIDALQSQMTAVKLAVIAWEKLTGESGRAAAEQKKHVEETNRGIDTNRLEIDKLLAELERLRQGSTKTFKEEGDEAEKAAEKVKKAHEKLEREVMMSVKRMGEHQKHEMIQSAKHVEKAFQHLGDAVGKAFVGMIANGKNMGEALKESMTKMGEQFLETVTSMIVTWAALRAVMMVLPGGPAAYQAASTAAYPSLSSIAGGIAGKLFGGAEGGNMRVSQPTLFLAGEGGQPEQVTVTPMRGGGGSSGGGDGGGGGVQIGSIVLNAYGVNDPQKLGRQIIEAIRGQGQLGFVRAH